MNKSIKPIKPIFHNEDNDGIELVINLFKKHPTVKNIINTSAIDQSTNYDVILELISGNLIYIEVKDRRDFTKHTSRNHYFYSDVMTDEYKKIIYDKLGITNRALVVAIWDDGFTIGKPSDGHLILRSVPRWTNSKSYVFNTTPEIESANYLIEKKRLWSMPIYKFIKKDLKLS